MKYSKQRELILNIVLESMNHPTAEEIYQKAQQKLPNISLGTVYRNLNYLVDTKQIRKIKGIDEKDHYDKDDFHHDHFFCKKCQKIYDIKGDLFKTLQGNIQKEGFSLESYDIFATGICYDCKKERIEKWEKI